MDITKTDLFNNVYIKLDMGQTIRNRKAIFHRSNK